MKAILLIAAFGVLPLASTASASERVATVPSVPGIGNIETLSVEITGQRGVIWNGTLTIGPRYGSASFSQSKSEAIAPCEGKAVDENRNTNVSSSFNLNLSRSNWQQAPNSFNVNFNQNLALPACEGQGTDSSGFNRMVEIAPGSSKTIRGKNGVEVTVSRP
jgi:hypothetical protein